MQRFVTTDRLCFLLVALALATASSDSSAQLDTASNDHYLTRIKQLRIEMRYADALTLSRTYASRLEGAGGPAYLLEDAHRLVRTLETAAALPIVSRRELARADGLDADIERSTEQWNFVEALCLSTEQLEIRSRLLGPVHEDTVDSHLHIAKVFHMAGRKGSDLEQSRHVLELRRETLGNLHPKVAESLVRYARAAKFWRDRDELIALVDEARRIVDATVGDEHLISADVYHARGMFMRFHAPYDEVLALYQRALDIRARRLGELHPETISTLCWMAHFVNTHGDYDEAERMINDVAGRIERCDVPDLGVRAATHNVLGWIATRRGNRSEAALHCEAEIRERSRLRHGLPMWLGLQRNAGDAATKLAEIRLAEGRGDEAWEAFQLGSGWITSAMEAPKIAVAGDPVAVARHDALKLRLFEAERRFAFLSGNPERSSVMSFEERESIRLSMFTALAALAKFESDIVPETPGPDRTQRLARLQRCLDANTAVVGWAEFVLGASDDEESANDDLTEELWAYVVRDHGPVVWKRMSRSARRSGKWRQLFSAAVETIRRASEWPQRAWRDETLEKNLGMISKVLFDPLEEHLDGVGRLVFMTDRLKHGLPLECLVDAEGTFLADRYVVSYATSADAYIRSVSQPGGRSSRTALLVGDPDYEGTSTEVAVAALDPLEFLEKPSGSVVDETLIRSALDGGDVTLPRLPMSRSEVVRISAMFNDVTELVGSQATEARLDEMIEDGELSRFGVIHFATHAFVHPREPELSSLMLSPSRENSVEAFDDHRIAAREIQVGWKLDAEVVTFSGCQTGTGVGSRRDGPLGFHQALFAAGARSVITSAWKVDDVATALLMIRFYENFTGSYEGNRAGYGGTPMRKADALREAKRWLRTVADKEGRTPFEHPAYWAGFVLIGDPN